MAKKIICKHCHSIKYINKTSGFIGVDFYKKDKKWRVRVTNNYGITIHLGYFKSELEASKVYDNYIIKNKIENRPLNHPKG